MGLRHYIKPVSLTWVASFVPLAAGAIAATEPLHQWTDIVIVINNFSDGLSPYALINIGLLGIGGRAALSKIEEKAT